MPSPTFKVEANHFQQQRGSNASAEKEKGGLTLKEAENLAHKWAKAGYFASVYNEETGECVAEAEPAEGD